MPRVFLMDEAQPNAFATGRNPENAAVAVTTGLMQQLSREELAGVIAHELAHIKNHDTLLMTITATIAGAISMIAQFGMFFGGNRDNNQGPGIIGSIAMMILAPLAAMLVQMAISRTREYAADDIGARICGQPMWLASALAKIENAAHQIPNIEAERNPATAHMFIINPLSGQGMDNLFATHPSTENRIAALQQLAAEIGAAVAAGVGARSYRRGAVRGAAAAEARAVGLSVINACGDAWPGHPNCIPATPHIASSGPARGLRRFEMIFEVRVSKFGLCHADFHRWRPSARLM